MNHQDETRRSNEWGNTSRRGISCPAGTCGITGYSSEHTAECKELHDAAPGTLHSFTVEGFDCADCVKSLEKAILAIPGVRCIEIFFSSGKVNLEYTGADVVETVYRTISAHGYRVRIPEGTETLDITVPEMDCQEEVKAIRKQLDSFDDIFELNFYPVNRKIRVTINRTKVEPDAIIDAIKSLGMTPSLIRTGAPKIEPVKGRSSLPLIISGVLLLITYLGSQFTTIPFFDTAAPYLYAVSIISGGFLVFRRAWFSLIHRSFDMNVLMTIAITGAAILGEWTEAAIVVILFALAQVLESHSLDRARKAIQGLMDQAPDTAFVRQGDEWKEVPSEEVKIGDIIRIRAGEKIPLDGAVIEGESTVNQAPITGESIPVAKVKGDTVFAGTVNEHGSLDVQVTHGLKDTTLARIVFMVEEAQARRAPAQAFIDRFSRYYTPAVIVIAFLVATVPVIFFNQPLGAMIYRALVLLLIACPCALVISTPVSILSGLSRAAKNGVLIKGGIHLENFASIDALAFDKTGTLTQGKPEVTSVIVLDHRTEDEVLAVAAGVEAFSNHPIAQAVVRLARERKVDVPAASGFKSITGMGARALINGEEYFVGSHRFFCNQRTCRTDAHERIVAQEERGKTVAVIGDGKDIIGLMVIADTLREESSKAIENLRKSGVETLMMLTGDHQETAKAIAEQLHIDYRAELLPEDKVKELETLRSKGKTVAMIGDGVNDAPALAAATVGVAMGAAGSDTALEVADIALLSDDLSKVPFTMRLARRTLGIIKQNIVLAIGLKLIFLVLASLGLATLWMAIFADMGASLLVIFNGLRLLRFR